MLRIGLFEPGHGRRIFSNQIWKNRPVVDDSQEILLADSSVKQFTNWNATQITSATTTTLVTPSTTGSLVVTDIVVSAKKVAGTTLDLEFDDGVNTVIFLSPDSVNNPVNFSWAPAGRVQGWRGASLKAVTVGNNTVATVTVVYMKLPEGLLFAEWDALR